MSNFLISETYKLPSLGKIYNVDVPEDVEIRSMNIDEEIMRLGNNGTWKSLCNLLDGCIVTRLPISTYDMCTADFTFLWHRLRVVTYGGAYPIDCVCPYCNTPNQFNIDLMKLPVVYYDADCEKYRNFELPISKKRVTINIQTPHMLDAIETRVRQQREKTGNSSNLLVSLLLAIDTVDGKKLENQSEKELFLRNLDMKDINKIIVACDKINNAFGLGVKIEAECENCKQTFTTMFQQGKEFFRPENDIEW